MSKIFSKVATKMLTSEATEGHESRKDCSVDGAEAESAEAPQAPVRHASFFYAQHRLGYACYDSQSSTITCGEAAEMSEEHPVLRTVVEVTAPTQVTLPSHCPPAMLAAVRACVAVPITFAHNCDFSIARTREQLETLWPQRPLASWASRISFNNSVMLMALGGLMTTLLRSGAVITDILEEHTQSVLATDDITREALQITRSEDHPAAARGIGKSKEGLSLLGLLGNWIRSPVGRALLQQWVSQPTNDIDVLQARHAAVEVFGHPSNREVVTTLMDDLRSIRYPHKIFAKIECGKHTISDWATLLNMCRSYLHIVEAVAPFADRVACAAVLVASCDKGGVESLAELVSKTIDFSMRNTNSSVVVVRSGVDPKLDELREAYASMDTFLTAVAQREVQQGLPWCFESVRAVFFPQVGYLLSFVLPDEGFQEGHSESQLHAKDATVAQLSAALPSNWKLCFATEGRVYCKTPSMIELDQNIGDLHQAIVELSLAALRALEDRVLALRHSLDGVRFCAELDCVLSYAMCAVEENWHRPTMTIGPGEVRLRRARHPLLSRCVQHVIPFDLDFAQVDAAGHATSRRCLLLTGPNGSGKSVMLRAVALIVYLSHIGSFVPCEAASIGAFDRIMTNIGAHEAVTRNTASSASATQLHSSFGYEVSVISRMITRATTQSLLVIDEFGRGTLASDGVAVLAATVQTFLQSSACPVILLATHYTEIIERRLIDLSSVLWLTTSVLVHDDGTVTYLYQLQPSDGVVRSSCALACAAAAGLPPAMIARAKQVLDSFQSVTIQPALSS